jgi:predicted metal-dependent HD superfamily phosphohydrolase
MMKKRWMSLPWNPNTSQKLREEKFENLRKAYESPSRGYHTLKHIRECLGELDEVKDLMHCWLSCELSIWYHDIVYETTLPQIPGRNELLSANWAMSDLMALGFDGRVVGHTSKLIIASQHSHAPRCDDEMYILDIDLTILGQSMDRVMQYEIGIRKEYPALMKDPGARQLRASILKGFLDRENIYYSPYFRKKYEKKARTNLASLIEATYSSA